ncbi:MAG TPA: hypothetical protein VHJ40_08080 [Actinomycetota bacterium]|nr:hypothetical protein [Actinomycetota bacterium]
MSHTAVEVFLQVGSVIAAAGAFAMVTRRFVPKKNPKDISSAIDLLELVAPYVLVGGIIMLFVGGVGWLAN